LIRRKQIIAILKKGNDWICGGPMPALFRKIRDWGKSIIQVHGIAIGLLGPQISRETNEKEENG